MTERITARHFHESPGVEDWRVLFSGACAHFRTGPTPPTITPMSISGTGA
jgi:hypothetical protein